MHSWLEFCKLNLVENEISNYNSSYSPILVVLNEYNNEPHTLYKKHFANVKQITANNSKVKKGEIICVIKIPLLEIINNIRHDPYWTISRGESGYSGILSYQPNIKLWLESIRVRYKALDRQFGCIKINSSKAGIFSYVNNELSTGVKITSGDVIGHLTSAASNIEIKSPVNGIFSSWLVNNKDIVHSNQDLASIRTFPPLLIVEVDYQFRYDGFFSCRAPISGTLLHQLPSKHRSIQLKPGHEVSENSIVCAVKNDDLFVAIFINECVGKILDVNFKHGSTIEIGEPIFTILPKYMYIRSPIVGTFYRQKEPWSRPHVIVGDKIQQGSVVCLIEAMKLYNDIESEINGTVIKILVEDATPVEYDQPMFLVQVYG